MSVNMSRPLQLLSLFSRLHGRSLTPSQPPNCVCGYASRGTSRAWTDRSHVSRGRGHREDMSAEEEVDLDDVEDKLQALAVEGRKRQKTVKYHILRRQMTPLGAPHRKLTWDAIEQIRYLKQEQPEEWTVQRLSEGFSVPPDVILRVLRTTFVPPPERKAKQDAKIMAALGQRVLPSGAAGTGQDRLKLPGNTRTQVKLLPGSKESAAVPAVRPTLKLGGEGVGSVVKSLTAPMTLLPAQSQASVSEGQPVKPAEEDRTTDRDPAEDDQDESWDGRVLSDKELEELMEMQNPTPVVRVGNEFLDAEGNFLYRI